MKEKQAEVNPIASPNRGSARIGKTDLGTFSICIVAHDGYGAISGGSGHVGGVERQTSLLARWLAARGHKVSYLTWHEGGPDEEMIDNVRVLKICPRNAGLPAMRFIHPKWSGLVRAMRMSGADLFYQNCGGCVTGQMAAWCKLHRKPLVYSIASDADCNPRLPELRTWRERVLYRHGIRNSTRRIAQTSTQADRLRLNFGLDSEVIAMPAPDPGDEVGSCRTLNAKRIVWVGRVCRVKRPDLILDVAAACPELAFDIAGPVYDDDYSRAVAKRAAAVPNVRMLGPVPRAEVPELYRSASLLCSTSDYEGFPNTFIEAWSHGVPVVSRVDPDGLIDRLRLGRVCPDLGSLILGIRSAFADTTWHAETSARVRNYYLEHHTIDVVMPRFEKLFAEVAMTR